MNFKVGDLVIAKEDWGYDWHVTKDHIYKVLEVLDIGIRVDPVSHIRENVRGTWTASKFELVPLDCKLNRVLYPDYIEFGDYLVPKKYKDILCG